MNEYPPVLSKRDFVRRYAIGEFGNAAPTWNTLEEYWSSSYRGLMHVRNRIAGAQTWYNVPRVRVPSAWKTALTTGYAPDDLYLSAMAPTEKTLLQGEVMRASTGLDLYYTRVRKPMRDALKEQSSRATGLRAVGLLRTYLCARSYDWLEELLDHYPGHVVEFSAYSVQWGTIPGYNTVFWEVRRY